MLKYGSLMLSGAVLAGCASMPDVTYHYYPAKSATTLSVTQSLGCTKPTTDGKPNRLIVASAVQTPTTVYSADYAQGPYPLRIKDLDGPLSDTDTTFTFTEDGRLKTVNATLTGQGETILKSAISLGTSIATLAGGALFVEHVPLFGKKKPPPPKLAEACKVLDNWPGEKPALTFTRIVNLGALTNGETITLNDPLIDKGIAVSDRELYDALINAKAVLPSVTMTVADIKTVERPVTYDEKTTGDVVMLRLQDTASMRVDFSVNDKPAASSTVTIPVSGSKYELALPKGAPFGNGKVALTLSDAGAITSLEYGKTNGSAGALNVASAATAAATPAASSPPADPPPPVPNPNVGGGPNPH